MSRKRLKQILFFLTLLTLPTQLGRHFWPGFSHIYSLKIDYLSPTIYLWDLLVVALIAVWIWGNPKFNRLSLNLVLFFLLAQGTSLLSAQNIGAGLVRLEQYLVAGMFGIYLSSQPLSVLKKQLYLPLTLSIFYCSLLAIWQFLAGKTLGLWILGERTFTISTPGIAKFDFYGYEFLRPYSIFPHPNVLAAYLLIISLLLSLFAFSKGKQVRVLTNLMAGLVVIMTVSRVVILSGLGALYFLLKGRWKFWLLGFFVLLSPILYTRYSALLNFDNLTLVRREELAKVGVKIFLERPILGVGPNNFIYYSSTSLLAGPSRFLQPVHNIYLLALSETGLVGLSGWLVLIAYPLLKIKDKKVLMIWVLVLFLGFFDHYFLTLPQGYRLLFLIWGITLALVPNKSQL